MTTISEALAHAVKEHQAGQLAAAERLYRQILDANPNQADALHLLGVIAHQFGRHQEAIEQIQRAISINPNNATYYSNLGAACFAAKRYEEAVETCRRAAEMQPESPESHNNLGAALKELSQFAEAVECYQRAVELRPDYFDARKNLASVLWKQGCLVEAEAQLRETVRLSPRLAEVHCMLGGVLKECNRSAEAVAEYKIAITLKPDYAEALNNLANLMRDGGQIDPAIALYDRALAIRNDYVDAINNKSSAYAVSGRFEEALAGYQQVISLAPDNTEARYNQALSFAQLGRFEEAASGCREMLSLDARHALAYRLLLDLEHEVDPREMLDTLTELLNAEDLPSTNRVDLYFALAKLYDRRQEYAQAFEAYRSGNQLAESDFDREEYQTRIDRTISVYSREYFQQRATGGSDSERCVFIVGMPRSGTTLVEQILCSHPQVHGAGELDVIHRFSQSIAKRTDGSFNYPEAANQITVNLSRELSGKYLAQASSQAGDELRITDKMPSNFLHLGLIATLFPQARVIHCRRDPRDSCLSCFFQNFNHLPFSFDLENLACYYRGYARLMLHWRDVLPGAMLEIDYESLVENQEHVSRQMVEFCNLPWDDGCLDFFKADRPVRTASLWQVRQPIYASSKARWKNYEQFLGPLHDLVALLPNDSSEQT